jgi:hypothetical protein
MVLAGSPGLPYHGGRMTTPKTEDAPVRKKPSRREPVEQPVAPPIASEAAAEEVPAEVPVAQEPPGRDRIQQQLEALKQREAELRRELAIADHPQLRDAILAIEGRAYGVTRVEAKMAEGLSKSEQRRKETLEKKLAGAIERRAEIDLQIAALELELMPLGEARALAFTKERGEALRTLAALLASHEPALAAASLDVSMLVPALASWRAEIDALRAQA